MRTPSCLAVLLLALSLLAPAADAEEPGEALRVGTKEAPPFSMKEADGSWRGISIELWEELATRLGYATTYQEVALDRLTEGVADGALDVSVAALTITPEREQVIDFTHPFHTSGLGIAVSTAATPGWKAILGRVLSGPFALAVLTLAGILALAGFVLWLFERKRNAEQFGGSTSQGLGNAFWWSAVTMTTVGYGDKAPVTLGGRLVGLVWMFASIILIAGLTGSIASALTVSHFEGSIQGPQDLAGKRVGTVPGSTSELYLQTRGIRRTSFETPREALLALAAGDVDAVVYDHPLLVWLSGHDDALMGRIEVLPTTFQRQDYALAIPQNVPRREEVNRVLLEILRSDVWEEILERYLGS